MIKPLVSIIIPVYNKGETLARAVASACAQTYDKVEVIIVNDGSTDDSAEIAQGAIEAYSRQFGRQMQYVAQPNQGVAIARNNGFDHSSGQLIVCLDSDDALGPRYVELLVPEIWPDREVGVVYTALLNVNPDGSEKVSRWPHKFDAYAHFHQNYNQVPTAAMARREVWERLAGQRQRYAPRGAGAEDGDFWLRAGTYGFGIKYVHPAHGKDSMFHYSTGQGHVSGNRDYVPVPWRTWSPWTTDPTLMPTASVAPAKRFSHPARTYQEPVVSVIIPVGPGHAKYLVDSLDSLDAQTFKKWEAIVVFDVSEEEWGELLDTYALDKISTGWPWARFTSTHAEGKFARELTDTLYVETEGFSLLAGLPAGPPKGAGVARNIGIRAAEAPLLIFLDADDYFLPTALEKMVAAYQRERKIIFSEHYGIAPIKKDELHLVHGEVTFYNDINGLAVIKQGVTDYKCEEAAEQPYTDGRVPYIICNVSSLIPKRWALELGGFPEDLPSWEDVLFWWQASWKGYCFYKISEPLLAYRYYTGERRERGREIAGELLREIKRRKEGVEIMGCGCGQAPGSVTVINSHGAAVEASAEGANMPTLNLSRHGKLQVDDADLILVEYHPPDQGDKLRFGQHDFGGGNFINYGRRYGNGERMMVHRMDIEAEKGLAAAQGRDPMYVQIAAPQEFVEESVEEPVEVPAPKTLPEAEEGFIFESEVPEHAENPPLEDIFPPRSEGEYPARLTPVEDLDTKDLRNPGRYAAILKANDPPLTTAFEIVAYLKAHPENGLEEIDGIGPKAAQIFAEAASALV